METKQQHLAFVRERGPFKLDCSAVIFGTDELELLHQWGHWFQGLQDGTLEPFTELQRNFIAVCRGEQKAISVEEKAWFKYINRKRIEAKSGDSLRQHYEYREQGFYTRDMKKQLNRMMYAEMKKNHKL
ncbi:DUF413 domain-containing protein [Mangrovibacterium diazotrophicum]|uniref:Macrodomain Ori protein n=1 Tax=Mangrovibacterium diazotrophicum TaxID=1261403 RepID=A0A419W3J9_9BACT|nr:DUF413 domain-containing protein [Mangrovibacterium diazotrophicum]RKD90047.1 hypothetical protein BC643_0383 [Mangrovibacterium diazotrophicum]